VSSREKIVIGTRGSALARWQADHIAAELRRVR
jgi:porphobilinogen deaminase